MQYINPIELLELSNTTEALSIDNEIIKKSKRKLFADIDLSDNGHFVYHDLHLTKGECEKVIDELSNKELKEFYLYLAKNKKLNNFLVSGSNDIFINFQHDSIFQLPEFVKFISPYFAPKFDKALLNAFETEDVEETKAILKTSFLISQSEINTAYKSVSNTIQNRIFEISEIRNDIKNEEGIYDEDNIYEVVDLVVDYFPSEILNCLPNYFQSQILKIANEINYLNVAIWDNFDDTQVCNDLLEHVLTFNIGGLDKPTFQKNYEIVRKKNQERIEQASNAPILRKYAGYLIESKTKITEIESKTTTPSSLLSWVNSTISISDVNNLSGIFDEIKNQIALSLRAMSVEVWNSYSNIDVSIDLINKANSIIGLKSDTKENIQDAKKQLTELKTKIDISNLVQQRATPPHSRPTSSQFSTKSSSKQSNSGLLIFSIIIIIGIIVWANLTITSSNDYPSSNDSYTRPATTNDNSYSNDNTKPSSSNEDTPPVESQYKGNQLRDGASPLTGCFGKGIFSGNATLTIKNGGNSDAIICLYSIDNGRTIRNEYVQKNSSFTMSNIAQGQYKIRVFYGNDWNPELENSCGTKGNFESDINFSEFDGTEYFEDSDRGFTTATITLYTVPGGNASSSAIDQSQFFRK